MLRPCFPAVLGYYRGLQEGPSRRWRCFNTLILVAKFKELIEELTLNRGLPLIFVQPKDSPENKVEYLRRVRARGNQETFAEMLEKNFSAWIETSTETYRNNSLVTIRAWKALTLI